MSDKPAVAEKRRLRVICMTCGIERTPENDRDVPAHDWEAEDV